MKIFKSERISSLLEQLCLDHNCYDLDVSEVADITASVDGDDQEFLIEESIKIGEKLNGRPIYKISNIYGIYYFAGTEEEIMDKINNLVNEYKNG